MKKILLISATVMLAHAAFSQGTVVFNNRIGASTTAAPGIVIAPIYNVDPANPTRVQRGNTSVGNPMGTAVYNGAPLAGTGFTATLWGLESSQVTGNVDANNLVLIGTTVFRTTTSGNFAGTVIQPAAPSAVPGVALGSDRGTFQMRVWDNKNGTIATWDQALTSGTALGSSDLFTVPFSLGGTLSPPNTPPNLQGLQSFQLTVPEPSVIALGVLGAGCLFLLRRRK
jgi:hypothetical protein